MILLSQIKILKRPSRSSNDQLNVTASLSQKDLHKARAEKEKEYERAKKRIFGTSEPDVSTSTSQTSEFPSASSSTRVGSTSTDKKKVINHKSSTRRSPVANPESPSQNKSNQFTLKSERPSRSKSNTSNQDTPDRSLAAFSQSPAKTQSDQLSISKTKSKNAGS
ncbi:hypothetical protein BKA69DRAFT_1044886 [Paraphysoderma sedebokerense]|nr:hypothetical protein BKA69DRAFT_1044886 [Paraphysoderma sedebokerense]